MNNPLISIVVPNFNYGRFLGEALESVLSQECIHMCELIVVDASSTDDSMEIIRRKAGAEVEVVFIGNSAWHVCERLTWISEADDGQSDAFNKGFGFAHGKYFTWLNSDEMYTPGALRSIVECISKRPDVDWITANDFSFLDDNRIISSLCWGPHRQVSFFTRNRVPSVVFGPSSFFSRKAFERVGGFDVNLKYGMDTDLWSKLLNAGYYQVRVNRFCWAFRWHSQSKTFGTETSSVRAEKVHEAAYLMNQNAFRYKRSLTNIYYLIWIAWRLFDGSLIMKYIMRYRYVGKNVAAIMNSYRR